MLSLASRPQCPRCLLRQQIRHATMLRRPKKPYTFTQLITLSDGSTFLHRTTSPQPVYRSTKDTKNSALWNPSSQKLLNVEEDEAGRLRRFRQRFGRGFDADSTSEADESGAGEQETGSEQSNESLLDLISGYGQQSASQNQGKKPSKVAKEKGGQE